MIEIKPYDINQFALWNKVVESSRNGTFLHNRNYMDYHADRFSDHSLILFRNEKPVAVFPASQNKTEITSHGGLTYGGLLSTEALGAEDTLQAFEALATYYKELGVEKIIYKPVPYIFYRYPCQEELYALFRVGATLTRRDASCVISLEKEFKFSKGRKWSINKAKKEGITIERSDSFSEFHLLLTTALKKFSASPTHTLEELKILKARFPENIVLYHAKLQDEILAGAIIYDFGETVHTQYLATSDLGRNIGALDILVATLIEQVYASKKYFSFGISTEMQGNFLNTGLIAQKEGFGARVIVHDFYDWVL